MTLFDGLPLDPEPAPPSCASSAIRVLNSFDRGLLAQEERQVRAGRHPTGQPLHSEMTPRCGSCAHLVSIRLSSKTIKKCNLDRATWNNSRGTDVRARWRACIRYAPEVP